LPAEGGEQAIGSVSRIPPLPELPSSSRQIHFVLVEPEDTANVGAAARALKNTGFERLVVVRRHDPFTPKARYMAHGATDILENAQHLQDFSAAIAPMKLVIGTTQRVRDLKAPALLPEEAAVRVWDVARSGPVALVFGRESTGLTNEELYRCHLVLTIPSPTRYPSYNLAQAVLLVAYTLFRQATEARVFDLDPAPQHEVEILYRRLQRSLERTGFESHDGIDKFMARFRRWVGRSLPERRDIRLLHKLLQIYEFRIAQLEKRLAENQPSSAGSELYQQNGGEER
jgi:TrmH family RNA methyltransferase